MTKGSELKDFLANRPHSLVLYLAKGPEGEQKQKWLDAFNEVAKLQSAGPIVQVGVFDCGGGGRDSLKVCKQVKVSSKTTPLQVRHHHGKQSDVYEWPVTSAALMAFLKNPANPKLPWHLDPASKDVVFADDRSLYLHLNRGKPSLVAFVTEWCGHCARQKPELSKAASQLKAQGIQVIGVDCDEAKAACKAHGVTGYPTLKLYNSDGQYRFDYSGQGRKAADFVSWCLNPVAPAPPPPPAEPESPWSAEQSSVHHITDDTWAEFKESHNSFLLMAYAPWCGHCKAMKPAFTEAANELKAAGAKAVLAAVDATAERAVASSLQVKGYPTLLYFRDGEFQFKYQGARDKQTLVAFMSDPKEPPPPPPPEQPWAEQVTAVRHLTDSNFHRSLKSKSFALVMFYSPSCGHCKAMKPAWEEAADQLTTKGTMIGAVDCKVNSRVASEFEISSYPTILSFRKGKRVGEYDGPRTATAILEYIQTQSSK